MSLAPEDEHRIYEEEKRRLEIRRKLEAEQAAFDTEVNRRVAAEMLKGRNLHGGGATDYVMSQSEEATARGCKKVFQGCAVAVFCAFILIIWISDACRPSDQQAEWNRIDNLQTYQDHVDHPNDFWGNYDRWQQRHSKHKADLEQQR